MSSILIVGAGELGLAMLAGGASSPKRPANTKITVLLRPTTIESQDPARKHMIRTIRGLGAQVQAGDFIQASMDELIAIFKPYDVVIQCAGYVAPEGTQPKITQAVLAAGVMKYIPWQFGLDYDEMPDRSFKGLFDDNKLVRRMLREQIGTNFTIVSTGLFMSYLFHAEFGIVDFENKVVRALGSWDNKVTTTIPDDIGKMVAEVIYNPGADTSNRAVYLSGDTLSYRELARTLEDVYGAPFTNELWDMKKLLRDLEEDSSNLWKKYRVVFASGLGVSWEQETSLNAIRHIPLMNVQLYIESTK